ncbi:MAG TPA: FG-GAP-like repeat-containing protein, partial [Bryobacteraceae bacterium]|nr:FG-GAP-like repeat-containing protein [Bryobacteraceae bacterium]
LGAFHQAPGSPYSILTGPTFVATGDFNGDAEQDIAILKNDGSLALLLGAGDGSFTAGETVTVASPAQSITVGDLNGDNILDIVIAENTSHSVRILQGDGAGHFTANVVSAGSSPFSVALGDYDGDGVPDLAIADSAGYATVLINHSGGELTPAPNSPFATGSGSTTIATADFNGDGKLDLAVGNAASYGVTILLNDGTGDFTSPPGGSIGTTSFPESISAGDYNGDGDPDLAIVTINGVVTAFGAGDGTFTTQIGGYFGADLAAAAGVPWDFNNDGYIDLLTVSAVANEARFLNGGPASVSVSLSTNAEGTVAPGTPVLLTATLNPSGPVFRTPSGAVTFLDGLSTIGTATESASPYTFTATGLTQGSHSLSASYAGDSQTNSATSDPLTIVVNANLISQTISFGPLSDEVLGTGDLPLTATATSGLPVTFSTVSTVCSVKGNSVTLTAPGICSITASQGGDGVYAPAPDVTQDFNIVQQQNISFDTIPERIFGTSPFTTAARASSGLPITLTSLSPTVCRTARDLITLLSAGTCTIRATQPGNSNFDAATPVTRSFKVNAALPGGGFNSLSPVPAGNSASSAVTGDFNNDSTPDLAVIDSLSAGNVTVLLGPDFSSSTSTAVGSNPSSIAVGDIDADGNLDFVTPNRAGNTVTLLRGDGAAGFGAFSQGSFSGPEAVAVGDFNGDGWQDVVVANGSANTVSLVLYDGELLTTVNSFETGALPRAIAVGDFNNDGRQDLAIANESSNNVSVLLGTDESTFTPAPGSPYAAGSSPVHLAIGDFNLDGVSDLAIANSGDVGGVSVLKGAGDGSFTPFPGGAPGAGNFDALTVSDFNGDGKPDIAAATYAESGRIVIFLGDGAGGFSALPSTFAVGAYPTGLIAADLNFDHIADLVATNTGDGTVSVLYGAAPQTQSQQTISFEPISSVEVGAHIELAATASSDLPVTFASSTTSVCTVSGASATAVAAGTCTIVASQAGDDTYAPASQSQSFAIVSPPARSSQTISFAPLPDVPFGTAPFTISATASSGLPVELVAQTISVCTVSGNQVTLRQPGFCSILAFQTGSSDFEAAATVTRRFLVLDPITITTSILPNGMAGTNYSAALAARGGTRGPYSWSLQDGSLPQGIGLGSNGLLSGNPSAAGTFTFTARASDGASPPATAQLSITVFSQLSILTTSLPNGVIGSAYGPLSISAKGGSGAFTWSASGLPEGLNLSAAGSLSGTPAAVADSLVAFTVTDSAAGQSLTAKIPLSIVPATTTLKANPSILTAGAAAGDSVTGLFTASGGTPPYKFSASGLPAGISLSETGELSGSTTAPGTYSAAVTVTDSAATAATATAGLTIHILGITSSSLNPGAASAFYTSTFSAAGGTPPVVFSADGLPAGLSLTGSGALTGAVENPGVVTFTVIAADSAGLTSSRAFTLTMGNPPVSAEGLTLPGGTVESLYSGSLKATGGAAPYSWSLLTGALPAGLSLSSSGEISGIPTAPGSSTIGLKVTDSSGGVASGGVTIAIAPAPMAIPSQLLPSGIVNFYYGPQIIDVTGGAAPYTFAVTGNLPPGLTLTDGVIGGTPTAAGTFPFTLKVTDSAGNTADAQSSIVIRLPGSDLLLLSGSVSFSLAQGAAVLPPAQSVGVQSTDVSSLLAWTASATPGANWLTVTSSGVTPGVIGIALNNAALSLQSHPSPAMVTVTCASPACQGKSQTIAVSLSISARPPQLGVDDSLLSFNSVTKLSQTIQIRNIGGGSMTLSSISCDAPWCAVGVFSSPLTGGASTQLTIDASATGLAPGFYRTALNIESSGGNVSIPVTFRVPANPVMTLAPSGTRFDMAAGGKPGNANGSFAVTAEGGTIDWSAAVKGDAPWLTLSTATGSSSTGAPGTVDYSIDTGAATLAPGAYYGAIEVTPSGASSAPQDFQIVLNVGPANAPPLLTPAPSGLTFNTDGLPQTVTVYSTSASAAPYQASASTTDGGKWLEVTPTTGTASSAIPGTATVSVKTEGLSDGVYTGSVSFAAASSGISTVNVSLVIPASAPVSLAEPPGRLAPRDECTATKVVPTQVGLLNSFSAPASWPTPISVQLSDDCGNIIDDGQVVATFSNGDPPLSFIRANPAQGIYAATWTPRRTSSNILITARGAKRGLTPATAQLGGAVVPNEAPAIDPNGVVHPYDPAIGGSLSPGTIVAIYGSHLGSQPAQPSNIPLPTKLNGTSVLIGGITSPLFYVSPSQINAQIPFELAVSDQYQVIVNANGALTPPQPIQLTEANPGLDTFPDGSLVAVHASDGTLISATSPAQRGEYVVLFLLGLGETDNPVTTGDSASGTVLARVKVPPVITMNGNPAPISFAGLAPGFVGLYQVNLQIPDGLPGGNVAVGVTQGDREGNSGILPIAY